MTQANPATTPISTSKSSALTRVLDLVTRGYTRYVTGTCPAAKAIGLARKFHDRYGIGCSPAQRITRKQRGQANTALVLYWPTYSGTGNVPQNASGDAPQEAHGEVPGLDGNVAWILLVTAGSGPVVEQEALCSVVDDRRLSWLGYELVRLPKRGGVSWTWRRPKSEMAEWYALLGEQIAHRKMSAVAETLCLIANQPGFAGVRKQGWELIQFARSRGYSGAVPFLFHLQKVHHGLPLRLN